MRICLVEDSAAQAELVLEYIERWQKENSPSCALTWFASAEEMLFELGDDFPFDLIILDIQMGKMNGMELAKRIRAADKTVTLAFLSALKDYVFEGYEVQAFRYLLKPVEEEALFALLSAVSEGLQKEKSYLIASYDGEKRKFCQNEIHYVEALAHYTALHMEDGVYQLKAGIRSIADQLSQKEFAFIHRSFLVNLAYVDRITRTECILSDGQHLPVSKGAYKALNEKFISYYKEEGLC